MNYLFEIFIINNKLTFLTIFSVVITAIFTDLSTTGFIHSWIDRSMALRT